MTQATAARTLDGVELPEAGAYSIDASHSSVAFTVRHLVVAKVRGRFGSFDGRIDIAERPEDSRAEVTIDAARIDTRDEGRDAHLRSPDFFDAERYPSLSFHSTGFRHLGGSRFELPGELAIRGVSNPVTLQAELDGVTTGLDGKPRAAFSAETEIDREAWGLTWNVPLEKGGVLVGRTIKIQIEVSLVREG